MSSTSSVTSSPRRALRTAEAAAYIGVSTSLMRKFRMRGPDDPLGTGPNYIRLSPSLIVYELAALDRWLDEKRGSQ
jgi:predicted DNA-binding transcriptional regulator AlpA